MSEDVKKNKDYDWMVLSDTYFSLALIGVTEIIKYTKMHNEVAVSPEIMKQQNFRSAHANYELLLPIVHNFKHGIELAIKTIGIIDYHRYEKNHDLLFLLNKLKQEADVKNKVVVKRFCLTIEDVVKKYYYGRYMPNKKGSNAPDRENQAERYPEYRAKDIRVKKSKVKKSSKVYRIDKMYEWCTRALLIEIKNDIEMLQSEFANLKREIQ